MIVCSVQAGANLHGDSAAEFFCGKTVYPAVLPDNCSINNMLFSLNKRVKICKIMKIPGICGINPLFPVHHGSPIYKIGLLCSVEKSFRSPDTAALQFSDFGKIHGIRTAPAGQSVGLPEDQIKASVILGGIPAFLIGDTQVRCHKIEFPVQAVSYKKGITDTFFSDIGY